MPGDKTGLFIGLGILGLIATFGIVELFFRTNARWKCF